VTELAVTRPFDNTSGEGRFGWSTAAGQLPDRRLPAKALGRSGSDQGAAFMSSMKMTTAEVRDEDTHVIPALRPPTQCRSSGA
jgi:hypothetical protein